MTEEHSPLINFLRGETRNAHPSNYDVQWIIEDASDEWMEVTHDYIQWCFPTTVPSRFHPSAPVLTDEDLCMIIANPSIRARLFSFRKRYMDFLINTREWRERHDHNQLRITRALQSTKIIFGTLDAQKLLRDVMVLAKIPAGMKVNKETLRIWQAMVSDG